MSKETCHIEKYILQNLELKSGQTIESGLIFAGCKSALIAAVIWTIFNLVALTDGRVTLLVPNIMFSFLVPIVILLSIKYNKQQSLQCSDSSHPKSKISPYAKVIGTCTGAAGIVFARFFFSTAPDNITGIVVSILSIFLSLLFISASVVDYYKVYLLRKYCPHLKNHQ